MDSKKACLWSKMSGIQMVRQDTLLYHLNKDTAVLLSPNYLFGQLFFSPLVPNIRSPGFGLMTLSQQLNPFSNQFLFIKREIS